MKLRSRLTDGVLVVDVEGKMIGGDDSEVFHEFIKGLLEEGHRRFVINLARVPWADSRGIGMLIGAHTSIKNADGRLVLTQIGERIDSILTLTRLMLIFTTFEAEDEAIRYLAAGPSSGADV